MSRIQSLDADVVSLLVAYVILLVTIALSFVYSLIYRARLCRGEGVSGRHFVWAFINLRNQNVMSLKRHLAVRSRSKDLLKLMAFNGMLQCTSLVYMFFHAWDNSPTSRASQWIPIAIILPLIILIVLYMGLQYFQLRGSGFSRKYSVLLSVGLNGATVMARENFMNSKKLTYRVFSLMLLVGLLWVAEMTYLVSTS